MPKLIFNYPFMAREYELKKTEIFIGRQNTNDITIPDYLYFKNMPSESQRLYLNDLTKISRIHARIFKKMDGWYIEDVGTHELGSRYGTYVNNARLGVKRPYKLQDGDIINFGPIRCKFYEK